MALSNEEMVLAAMAIKLKLGDGASEEQFAEAMRLLEEEAQQAPGGEGGGEDAPREKSLRPRVKASPFRARGRLT